MNTADLILIALILGALALAFLSIHRRRKSGRGCCGSCSGCSGTCQSRKAPPSGQV